MKITEIIDFFAYISEVTNMYISGIEVKPMKVKGDLYATGFKRKGLGVVEVHLKELKTINKELQLLKNEPEGEIWIQADMLEPTTLKGIFNDVRNHFYALKEYDVADLRYRLKTPNNSDYILLEEAVVYDNKTQACREVIQKRKIYDQVKSRFYHFGNGNNTELINKITDLEFAEAEMA